MELISEAGGPTNRAAPKRTKVVRIENGEEKEFKPSMSDLVQPNDIIEVPEGWF